MLKRRPSYRPCLYPYDLDRESFGNGRNKGPKSKSKYVSCPAAMEKIQSGGNRRAESMRNMKTSTASSSYSSIDSGTSNLDQVYLMDCCTCERISLNDKPHRINNEVLSGYVLPIGRTEGMNMDRGSGSGEQRDGIEDAPKNDYANHFSGRKRRFEFQFQVKFKKKIDVDQLCIGCELKKPLNLGPVKSTFVHGLLEGIRKRYPGFQYSLGEECMCAAHEDCDCGDNNDNASPNIQSHQSPCFSSLPKSNNPHLSLPFKSCIRSLVQTPPGQTPPKMGDVLEKRSAVSMEYLELNTTDTFTFVISSASVDLPSWQFMNLVPFQPVRIQRIIGDQVFTLHLYNECTSNSNDNYSQMSKTNVGTFKSSMAFEFGHETRTEIGPCRRVWLQKGNGSDRCNVDIDSVKTAPARVKLKQHDIIVDNKAGETDGHDDASYDFLDESCSWLSNSPLLNSPCSISYLYFQ